MSNKLQKKLKSDIDEEQQEREMQVADELVKARAVAEGLGYTGEELLKATFEIYDMVDNVGDVDEVIADMERCKAATKEIFGGGNESYVPPLKTVLAFYDRAIGDEDEDE